MSCGCPQGYDLNPDTNLCERLMQSSAILNPNPKLPTYGCSDINNMRNGTAVYLEINTSQFPLIGINGPVPSYRDSQSNILTPFAYILSGDLWISGGKLSGGRLNQAGIGFYQKGEWQGYIKCITINEGDRASIAISSTYAFRVFVNGDLAVYWSNDLQFQASDYLHVFPLNLPVGDHCILFEGMSLDFPDCTAGSFVCEIYKNVTAQILSNIINQEELNNYYAGTSINGIGEPISTLFLMGNSMDTGSGGNYSCTRGFLNSCVEGEISCQYIDTVVPIPCCFQLTNCATADQFVTTSDLSNYMHGIVKLNELVGCYSIYPLAEICQNPIQVTVKSFYSDCADCQKVYYKLIDCTGNATSILTSQNLSAYVGKIIKIDNHNVCWIVVISSDTQGAMSVNLIGSFNNCEDCL